MNKIIRWVLLAAVGLTALFIFQKYRIPPKIKVFEMQLWHQNGAAFDISREKPPLILFSFFGTWCINCIDELPELNRLASTYPDKIQLYLITEESPSEVERFLSAHVTNPELLWTKTPFKSIGIYTYPTNYLIDRQSGEILFSKSGMLGEDTGKLIQKILDYSSR